jgi:hypothetical protein
MNQPIYDERSFSFICCKLLSRFSARFPDAAFHFAASEALVNLLVERDQRGGEPGGWVGGLVYMIAKHDPEIKPPPFNNSDLEEVFGVSMSTIRKRADKLWPVVFPKVFSK